MTMFQTLLTSASQIFDGVTVEDESLAPALDAASAVAFAVGGFVALVVIFLAFDMVRRIRRTRYREEIRAEIAAEVEQMESEGGPPPGPRPA